ncbi:MAG TPA: hypothetical protein PLD70_12915, partial [Thermotogota bacterium]|nr:hypothetical protein [Thermotogota bacterium]
SFGSTGPSVQNVRMAPSFGWFDESIPYNERATLREGVSSYEAQLMKSPNSIPPHYRPHTTIQVCACRQSLIFDIMDYRWQKAAKDEETTDRNPGL